MSSSYRKIKYVQEGYYGLTEEKTLYIQYNNTTDHVTFKDENGETIFSFGEWGNGKELDLGQAIVKILSTSSNEQESCTIEEKTKIFK